MKRMILPVGIVCVIFIAGCGIESPSSVARKFFVAISKGDVKAMEKVATPDAMKIYSNIGDLGNKENLSDKEKEELAEFGKIKSITHTIEGDTAVVTVTLDNGQTSKLDLIKEKGKWKVTFKK